ncbi:hypothetical protein [Duganella callida]|uniref:hypothetical protein n=1 Tax=Duganella callida TaxID=2561932 RepID=UPI0014310423|nr:hypothetical protein [Duganella callida]
MSFASWGGKEYLVAAYTCTPLVTIPLDALMVRGGNQSILPSGSMLLVLFSERVRP